MSTALGLWLLHGPSFLGCGYWSFALGPWLVHPWSLSLGPWIWVLGSSSMLLLAPGPWLVVLGAWSWALGPYIALSMWLLVPAGLMVHGSWSLVPGPGLLHGPRRLVLGSYRLLAFGTIAWLLHGIYMALGSWLPWSLTLAWSLALGFGSGYRFGRCYKYIYIYIHIFRNLIFHMCNYVYVYCGRLIWKLRFQDRCARINLKGAPSLP